MELYPTALRGKAFGLCKVFASLASVFSPTLSFLPMKLELCGMFM